MKFKQILSAVAIVFATSASADAPPPANPLPADHAAIKADREQMKNNLKTDGKIMKEDLKADGTKMKADVQKLRADKKAVEGTK